MDNFGSQFPSIPSNEIKEPEQEDVVLEAKKESDDGQVDIEDIKISNQAQVKEGATKETVPDNISITSPETTEFEKKRFSLSKSQESRVKELIGKGETEGLFIYLKGLGIPATTQNQIASHFMKNLEESIRRISWTKERLLYMTGLLVNTLLRTEDSNVVSAGNLILNYLVFSEKFKEKEENKNLRYGQFAYVMRSVFAGVTDVDDIYNRIGKHKTFGEEVNKDEVAGMVGEIDDATKKAIKRQQDALEKKRKTDSKLKEAAETERNEKGRVWNGKYAPPKEYTFPNYIFQTGDKKGKNTSIGRSTWEPLFEAYADTVNKKMEDRISAKTNLNDEEKQKRIREQRIELLYEKFEFPVGIRTDGNGGQVPIVYILDFIDINRWRGIEIKGPLTPKAAEKIKQFQKYYVDGDFSGLPEDEQIIMMSYVQNKLDEIKDWCIDNDRPVFDHFSSLEVLGMYKWDKDLNNFNRYEEARHMKELSVKQRQQLQKGFIKLVEDRVESGRLPDIRPEHYVDSEKLPEIEKINKKVAKGEGETYVVEKPNSTKPYVLSSICKLVVTEYMKLLTVGGSESIATEENAVIETIPITPYEREVFSALTNMFDFNRAVTDLLKEGMRQLSVEERNMISNSGRSYSIALPKNLDTSEYLAAMSRLKTIRSYLLKLKETGVEIENSEYDPERVLKLISLLEGFYKAGFNKVSNRFQINGALLSKMMEMRTFPNVPTMFRFFQYLIIGKHRRLFDRRGHEVTKIVFEEISQLLSTPQYLKRMEDNLHSRVHASHDGTMLSNDHKAPLLSLIKTLLISEGAISAKDIIPFEVAAEFTFEKIDDFSHFIEGEYKNTGNAAQYFASHSGGVFSENDYLEVLNFMKSMLNDRFTSLKNQNMIKEYLLSKKEIIVSMAEIILKEKLGEDGYKKLMNQYQEKYEQYIKD